MSAKLPERFTPEVWARIDVHRGIRVFDEATYREVVGCYDGRDRKGYLMLLHPDAGPELAAPPNGCVNPPGPFRPNAHLRRFRDTCIIPMMKADPDNPNWPLYLAQVERILAWRGSIPIGDRFWRPDED